ncbi:hypothetical protein V6N12_068416 [Hibiscus sabdariffa]|uniref:Uncharacterized protein n=1 Tax=Hibiscus sabdariffa TaxID=183260 RepID=A0ABR2FQ29_9ROSI
MFEASFGALLEVLGDLDPLIITSMIPQTGCYSWPSAWPLSCIEDQDELLAMLAINPISSASVYLSTTSYNWLILVPGIVGGSGEPLSLSSYELTRFLNHIEQTILGHEDCFIEQKMSYEELRQLPEVCDGQGHQRFVPIFSSSSEGCGKDFPLQFVTCPHYIHPVSGSSKNPEAFGWCRCVFVPEIYK